MIILSLFTLIMIAVNEILSGTFYNCRKPVILFAIFIISASSGFAQSVVFTSDGTFTVPAGVTSIVVECWGAGGAGGGSSINGMGGSGGGGGGYARGTFNVTPGQEIDFEIGTGGTGVAGESGNPGSHTVFLTLCAFGGSGGGGNLGPVGTGGSASGGYVNIAGSNGLIGTSTGGNGGDGALGGNGGEGNKNGDGDPGTEPGGGGGGGERTNSGIMRGGNGADGQITISWPQIYYAWQSGNVSTLSNWNTSPDGTGSFPVSFSANYQLFVIPDGINMTASSLWGVSGTGSSFQVQDGGTYIHGYNGGIIPLALWSENSSCIISGVTNTVPGGIDQTFGNFIWNSPGQGVSNLDLLFTNGTIILGNFNLVSSGTTGSICLSNNTTKLMTINGDLIVSGGTLNLIRGTSFNRIQTINLKGDMNISGGTITETNTRINSGGSIIFSNSGEQTFTKSNGTISNTIDFTINNGSVLNTGTSVIDGSGDFTLQSGAAIKTAHPEGLSNNAAGSVQVSGTRTFNSAASYEYNGSVIQSTGNGIIAAYVLTLNNVAGVSLTSSINVSGSFVMNNGNLNTGANILTITNNNTASLQHTSGTVIGRLCRAIDTTPAKYLFPVGTEEFYRPAEMNFSSLSAATNITATFTESSPGAFTSYSDGNNLNFLFSEGFWRFYNSGTITGSYSLLLKAEGFTSYNLDETSKITGRTDNNPTWRAMGTHAAVAGNEISRIVVEAFNNTSFDFALATCNELVTSGYSYERIITIDHSMVAGNEDLFNFPVMIKLTGQDFLKNVPAGRISSSNGWDIVFSDNSNNKLDHQIEYFNGTSGDLIAWVRIPVLSVTSNTVIKMLYGHPGIISNPSVTSVWDSHYKGVWHFDNSSLADFTSFNKEATPYNSPTYPAGVINNALGLNGSNEYAVVQNAPNLNFAGNITISAWVYMNERNRDQKIAGNQNGSSGGFKFGIYSTNKVEFEIRNSGNEASLNREVDDGTILNTGEWYYLAGMSSDVLDSIKTFVNGIPERPFKKTGILGIASDNLVIGKEPFENNYYFSGRFDELRISDKVRSDGWLRTEYFNQSSPLDFYTVGAEIVNDDLPSISLCDGPQTLTFGFPAGGTYSGTDVSENIFSPQSAGVYTITYTIAGACSEISVPKNILVTPRPESPVAPDMEFCSDQISYLQATGTNIKWYRDGILVSTANPYSPGITEPGTYTFTVTQTVNGCESLPETVLLNIYNSIIIIAQPENTGICFGGNGNFIIEAMGYNESYQWQEDSGSGFVNISDNSLFNGCTSQVLTIFNPGTDMTGRAYRCIVSSTCGSSLNSNVGILTVNIQPEAEISYPGLPWCPNAGAQSVVLTGSTGGQFSSPAGLSIDAASGTVLPAASTPSDYIVTYTIPASGGCDVFTTTTSVSISTSLSWTGDVGTDWTDPANWTCGMVPTPALNVSVPEAENDPVIGSAATGIVNNLTMLSGSYLNVSGTLRISGSLTAGGTISFPGTLVMEGTVAQSIPGSIFEGDSLRNLIVDNIAGVTLLDKLNVTGFVRLDNGDLVSDGNLTLLSNSTGTALISGAGSGNVTGDVTMQRYLSSGYGYKYFSSPFADASVDDFDDENLNPDYYNFFSYDENRNITVGVNNIPINPWVNISGTSTPLLVMRGYSINFGSIDIPKTVDMTGTVNNGTFTIDLENNDHPYTTGFNLVGNPYPSPVNWRSSGWSRNNIDSSLYFFSAGSVDPYEGVYTSWVNGVSVDGLASHIIPAMQGFFVHVSDDVLYPVHGSMVITNSARVDDNFTQPFLKKRSYSDDEKSLIRLSCGFLDNPDLSDPLVVYIEDKASYDYDGSFDALKMLNTESNVPSFWSYGNDGSMLSINGIPQAESLLPSVPLGLSISRDGEVTFRILACEGSMANQPVYLYDSFTGVSHDLTAETSVYLETADYPDRFFLNFRDITTGKSQVNEDIKPAIIWSSGETIYADINCVLHKPGLLTVWDLTGRAVFNHEVKGNGLLELNPGLKNGLYIVTLMGEYVRVSEKIYLK